jgi:hypothetical protein
MRYLRKRYGRRAAVFVPFWTANAAAHAGVWLVRSAAARDPERSRSARRWAGAYLRAARTR